MIKSKSIDFLKILTHAEFKSFGKFISSPYCNSNKKLIRLYELLKKYYPDFNSEKFTKKEIYLYFFKDRYYNDDKVRDLLSDLYKTLELFLSIEKLKGNEFEKGKFLLEEFILRGQKTLPAKKVEEVHRLIQKTPELFEGDRFYKKYAIEMLNFENSMMENKLFPDSISLQKSHDYFMSFFLFVIMDIYEFMIDVEKLKKVRYKIPFLKQIVSHVKKSNYEDAPLIDLYLKCLLVNLNSDNEEFYYDLKNYTLAYMDSFDAFSLNKAFGTLINFCNINSSKDQNFFRESFELNKIILEFESIVNDLKHSSYLSFITIIKSALESNEIKWAEDFISDHMSKLQDDKILNTANFCDMLIFLYKGEFERSLNSLSRVKADDHWLKSKVKEYTIILYYELGETELLYSTLETYLRFSTSNKDITEEHSRRQIRFLKLVKNLIDLKLNYDKFKFEKLRSSLFNARILHRHWLLNKINELQ
jgi:hypothetical protein